MSSSQCSVRKPDNELLELCPITLPLNNQVSGIGICLLLHFGRLLHHSPNRFSARWKVDLIAPPIVYGAQKSLRHAHLKRAILRPA
jgi:hypothetical protein